MAIESYLVVTDEKGQQIKGDVKIADYKDNIGVIARSNKVEIPVDDRTKENRGVRIHGTYNLTTILGSHAPYFFDALKSPRKWQSIEIKTVRVNDDGHEEVPYTEKLSNVRVQSAEIIQKDVTDEKSKHIPELLTVKVAYEKIERTWKDGNITSVDDWKASRSGAGAPA